MFTCKQLHRPFLEIIDGLTIGYKWDKVFKNGPSEICGRQPLKNLKF